MLMEKTHLRIYVSCMKHFAPAHNCDPTQNETQTNSKLSSQFTNNFLLFSVFSQIIFFKWLIPKTIKLCNGIMIIWKSNQRKTDKNGQQMIDWSEN